MHYYTGIIENFILYDFILVFISWGGAGAGAGGGGGGGIGGAYTTGYLLGISCEREDYLDCSRIYSSGWWRFYILST